MTTTSANIHRVNDTQANLLSGLIAGQWGNATDTKCIIIRDDIPGVSGLTSACTAYSEFNFTSAISFSEDITVSGTLLLTTLNAHETSATVHFTEASIDHTSIANIGTNTHANIDSHITSASVHFLTSDVGDVSGAGSSTDNAIARFDGTGGKTLQNSSVIVDNNGNMTLSGGNLGIGIETTYNFEILSQTVNTPTAVINCSSTDTPDLSSYAGTVNADIGLKIINRDPDAIYSGISLMTRLNESSVWNIYNEWNDADYSGDFILASRANATDFLERFRIEGDTGILSLSGSILTYNDLNVSGTTILNNSLTVNGNLILESGVLDLKETTTPTSASGYGKIYTKTDNKIYFQSGDGIEHEITLTP